jgi:hypothetical protein
MNLFRWRSRWAWCCFVIGGAAVQASLPGCVAYRFSSDVPPGREVRPSATLQNFSLGVEARSARDRSPQLEKFVENLSLSRVFKTVGYTNRLPAADLVLDSFSYRETDPLQACLLGFEGQLLTMATLGLLPQICQAEHQISFVLYASTKPERRKNVSFSYRTRTVLGWIALVYLPSAAWTAQPPKEKYPDLLKAVFAREAEEIVRLVQ